MLSKVKYLIALLLFASPAFAQTVTNPSFEANPPTGNYNIYVCPQAWTCVAQYYGMQNSTPAQVASGINGNTVAWVQGGSITQDIGPAVAATNYSLTVSVGSQVGFYGNYTISYGGCTVSGTTTVGSLVPVTLPCPAPTGELIISLATTSGQVLFDNVTLTSTPSVILAPVTLNLTTKIVFCVTCDRTDDTPAQGSLAFSQNGNSTTFPFASDGSIAVNVTFSMNADPVDFTVFLMNASGQQATGSGWEWKIPRASFSAGVATLGTLSFGGIAFTLNSDGSVSFAGFLPAQ